MHDPDQLHRTVEAATDIPKLIERKEMFTKLIPGYLSVANRSVWGQLLLLHVGTRGQMCHPDLASAALEERRTGLTKSYLEQDVPINSQDFLVGANNGAIATRSFELIYASAAGDAMGDGALVTLIALRAGLVSRAEVWRTLCMPSKPKTYNKVLHQMMQRLTWTS